MKMALETWLHLIRWFHRIFAEKFTSIQSFSKTCITGARILNICVPWVAYDYPANVYKIWNNRCSLPWSLQFKFWVQIYVKILCLFCAATPFKIYHKTSEGAWQPPPSIHKMNFTPEIGAKFWARSVLKNAVLFRRLLPKNHFRNY